MERRGVTSAMKRSVNSAEIEEAVFTLVGAAEFRSDRILTKVETLAKKLGPGVYPELLWSLAHLRFSDRAAFAHWGKLVKLRTQLSRKLKMSVDLRVALVDYFLQVNRKLKHPTILELKLYRQTQDSAYRDELTGLYNYRYLRDHIAREIERVERYDTFFSLVMFDLDNFKRFNDTRGHQAGNEALSAVGQELLASIRKVDVAARYGGEEFTLILPATPKDRAVAVAERARERVEKRFKGLGLTVSGGVATHPIDGFTTEELLKAADQAMYTAKSEGKNRICLSQNDRRSFARIAAKLDGKYRAFAANFRPLNCLDLSEGGLLFRTEEPVAEGGVLDLKLHVPGITEPITCVGRAVRVVEISGIYEVGVSFVNFPDRGRRLFVKFIRSLPRS